MHAYAVQPSAGLVKLDAMENPFRLPEALQRGARRAAGPGRDQPLSGDAASATSSRALANYVAHARRLQADARQRLRRADLAARHGLRPARRGDPRAGAGLRDVRDVGAAAGPEVRRRAADRRASSSTSAAMLAAIEPHRPGAHLHRLSEQPDRQPVRRTHRRARRRRGRRAGRAGRLRRGLPAVLVALPGCRRSARCRTCWCCAR